MNPSDLAKLFQALSLGGQVNAPSIAPQDYPNSSGTSIDYPTLPGQPQAGQRLASGAPTLGGPMGQLGGPTFSPDGSTMQVSPQQNPYSGNPTWHGLLTQLLGGLGKSAGGAITQASTGQAPQQNVAPNAAGINAASIQQLVALLRSLGQSNNQATLPIPPR